MSKAPLTVILGTVDSGKSTLALHLLNSHSRRIILDPQAEHRGDLVYDSLADTLQGFAQGGPDRDPVTIVIQSKEDAGDYSDYLLDFLCDCRGWTIFIDEVDRFCSPRHLPRNLFRLLNYRKHYGITLIVVARRAAMIHRDVTALASRICIFHTHEGNDLAYIRATVGEKYAEMAPDLLPHWWIEKGFPPTRQTRLVPGT